MTAEEIPGSLHKCNGPIGLQMEQATTTDGHCQQDFTEGPCSLRGGKLEWAGERGKRHISSLVGEYFL